MSSWNVETCYEPDVAWEQYEADPLQQPSSGGAGGATSNGGASGGQGEVESDAGSDLCPPRWGGLTYGFSVYGPVEKDGQCCYGYVQICG
jgi:hypothetical protein